MSPPDVGTWQAPSIWDSCHISRCPTSIPPPDLELLPSPSCEPIHPAFLSWLFLSHCLRPLALRVIEKERWVRVENELSLSGTIPVEEEWVTEDQGFRRGASQWPCKVAASPGHHPPVLQQLGLELCCQGGDCGAQESGKGQCHYPLEVTSRQVKAPRLRNGDV